MMQYSSSKGKRYTDYRFSAQPLPFANLGSTQKSRSNCYTVSVNALESTNTWIPLVARAGGMCSSIWRRRSYCCPLPR